MAQFLTVHPTHPQPRLIRLAATTLATGFHGNSRHGKQRQEHGRNEHLHLGRSHKAWALNSL